MLGREPFPPPPHRKDLCTDPDCGPRDSPRDLIEEKNDEPLVLDVLSKVQGTPKVRLQVQGAQSVSSGRHTASRPFACLVCEICLGCRPSGASKRPWRGKRCARVQGKPARWRKGGFRTFTHRSLSKNAFYP